MREEEDAERDSYAHEPIERCSSPALREAENSWPRNVMVEINANSNGDRSGDLQDHRLLGKKLLREVNAALRQISHAQAQSARWAIAGRCKDFAALILEFENQTYIQQINKVCSRALSGIGNGHRNPGFREAMQKSAKIFRQLSQAIAQVRDILDQESQAAVAPIQLVWLIEETKERLAESREIIEDTIMMQNCIMSRIRLDPDCRN